MRVLPWPHLCGLVLFLALVTSLTFRARRSRRLEIYLLGGPGPQFWPGNREAPRLPRSWVLRGALLAVACAALGWSLDEPSLGVRRVVVPSYPPPLILLLDVSRSMTVADVPGGRINAARLLARRSTMVNVGVGVDVALVAFSGEAHLLLPPTPDASLLTSVLGAATPEIMTREGTDLEGALRMGMGLLEEGGLQEGANLLILSDGEVHAGEEGVLALAREIRERGGRVSAVAFGTTEGGAVPLPSPSQALVRSGPPGAENEGGAPWSRARPALLAGLARAGGGAFASGEDGGSVSRLLAMLRGSGSDLEGLRVEAQPVEGWPWLLALALAALSLELMLATPRGGRAGP